MRSLKLCIMTTLINQAFHIHSSFSYWTDFHNISVSLGIFENKNESYIFHLEYVLDRVFFALFYIKMFQVPSELNSVLCISTASLATGWLKPHCARSKFVMYYGPTSIFEVMTLTYSFCLSAVSGLYKLQEQLDI